MHILDRLFGAMIIFFSIYCAALLETFQPRNVLLASPVPLLIRKGHEIAGAVTIEPSIRSL